MVIAFIPSCNLFGQFLLSTKKFLEIENGNFAIKIVIIDKNSKQYEYSINPGLNYGWSEDLIGDFRFIYIKSESNIEGIVIIENKYKEKLFPYDILTKEEYDRKMVSKYYENKRIMSYDITIKIINNKFEIVYDDTKFIIHLYYNDEEDYLKNKEKYMKEFDYKE
jgi:hypothetical protein